MSLVASGTGARALPAHAVGVAALFAVTLFLSAFLLFTVEFIVAKAVLPSLGGVPMVWNTCMVFFQVTLLAGYVYAHGATAWLGTRRQAAVYAVLLALPLILLPFSTTVSGVPPRDASPIGWLILVLLGWIGLPFFVLSASAALLQKWFSTIDHAGARDPYFLYAASNLGSLLALIAYPSVIEPALRLHDQSRLWSIGYATFVCAAALCAVITLRRGGTFRNTPGTEFEDSEAAAAQPTTISPARRLRWVALSFIPSSLMLAVTTYLSTDIASVPLLWMVPLSLYLLTFVLAFGSRSRSGMLLADRAVPLFILPLVLLMVIEVPVVLWLVVSFHLAVFTAAGLLCHGQLAADRPSSSSLTEFYFWIALGGMAGGVFNTLAAPILFQNILEYPLVLVMVCLFRPTAANRGPSPTGMDLGFVVITGLVTAGLMVGVRSLTNDARLMFAALAVPAFVAFSQSRRYPLRFGLVVGAMLMAGLWVGDRQERTLHTERTFFGVYRVGLDASGRYRALFNGTTLHGIQAVDPKRRREPLSYYYPKGPLAEAFARVPNMARATDVAVVGLGVGSLAAYAGPGQHWTFFELDPAVERLARNTDYFSYLRDCGDRCRVVLGDARVSLSSGEPHVYGLIVIDAFSSDAIPIHLLTSEAFGAYLAHLEPRGVLAIHISNRHLSLAPVIGRIAQHHGLTAIERQDINISRGESLDGKTPSDWVLMARHPADLGPLVGDAKWVPPVAGTTPLWTDDASSIVGVLRLGSLQQ